MTVPRELSLVEGPGGVLLRQRPAAELDDHGRTVIELDEVTLSEAWRAEVGEAFDLRLAVAPGAELGLLLLDGAVNVTWRDGLLVVTRSVEGLAGADPAGQEALVDERGGGLDLRVVVDTCSVELFADDGTVVLTNQVFPLRPVSEPLVLLPRGSGAHVRRLLLRDLSLPG